MGWRHGARVTTLPDSDGAEEWVDEVLVPPPNDDAAAEASGQPSMRTAAARSQSTRARGGGRREAGTLAACISACAAAYGVYFGLPLILVSLAATYGFTNPDLGWISAAENVGLLVGAVGVSVLARGRSYRSLAGVGIMVAVVADVATLGVSGVWAFCAIRLFAGFGSGLCYSAAIATLSRTTRVARNFSILAAILVVVNSLELWVVPRIAELWGVQGIYVSMACLYLLPALLLMYVPGSRSQGDPETDVSCTGAEAKVAPAVPQRLLGSLAWQCLWAVILFNLAASAFYAFSGRIGTSIGLSKHSVSNILTICNLISGTGSVLAYGLSRRWGQHRPQLAALAVMIAVFVAWTFRLTASTFMVGTLIFFEVWTTAVVYQLGTLSNIDGTGRKVALIPAAQGIGQSVGPFIAGALLAVNFSFSQMLLAAAVFAAGSFALYAMVYTRLRFVNVEFARL